MRAVRAVEISESAQSAAFGGMDWAKEAEMTKITTEWGRGSHREHASESRKRFKNKKKQE